MTTGGKSSRVLHMHFWESGGSSEGEGKLRCIECCNLVHGLWLSSRRTQSFSV